MMTNDHTNNHDSKMAGDSGGDSVPLRSERGLDHPTNSQSHASSEAGRELQQDSFEGFDFNKFRESLLLLARVTAYLQEKAPSLANLYARSQRNGCHDGLVVFSTVMAISNICSLTPTTSKIPHVPHQDFIRHPGARQRPSHRHQVAGGELPGVRHIR